MNTHTHNTRVTNAILRITDRKIIECKTKICFNLKRNAINNSI
jgi:hypothetical protein